MGNMEINIDNINMIIKKIIGDIGSSRETVLVIIDNVRDDYEKIKLDLSKMKEDISRIIDEVDMLEKQDKIMRQKLVEVSRNFKKYNETDIKEVYDKASEIRIKLITKTNEEMALRVNRDRLEISLKKSMVNIDCAEKVINQMSIALSYLEGDVLSRFETTDKNSEMFLGIKVLEAQENERKRIARDIHDGPAQYMANAIMKVDICSKMISRDVDEGLKELSELKVTIKKTLKEVRNIIFDLRPMALDDLGLNQSIKDCFASVIEDSKITVDLKLKPMKAEIESIIQVAIYRIIQEIFNNIKKHSKASHVEVSIDYGIKYLIMLVSDNGVGFDVEETLTNVKTKGNSYGLIGIFDRVSQLQGEIQIKSEKGVGTIYTVRLPINREVIADEKRND